MKDGRMLDPHFPRRFGARLAGGSSEFLRQRRQLSFLDEIGLLHPLRLTVRIFFYYIILDYVSHNDTFLQT